MEGAVRALFGALFLCMSVLSVDAACLFGIGDCPRTFRDCSDCPEMVVVPAGSFMMGSAAKEPGHSENEQPQHKVTIADPLAIAKFEVTFDEWDACVADGGCQPYCFTATGCQTAGYVPK